MAEAYIPNPDNLPQVGHKDESKDKNYVSNLEWTTNLENSRMPLRRERCSKAKSKPVICIELDKVFPS